LERYVPFSCLKHYSNLLLIPKYNCNAWVPSSRRPQETPAITTPNPYGIHHCHLYTCTTIFAVLAHDSKADGGNLNIHQTTNLLWYERNNNILIVSFRMSDRLNYFITQLQGSLYELMTHFHSLYARQTDQWRWIYQIRITESFLLLQWNSLIVVLIPYG